MDRAGSPGVIMWLATAIMAEVAMLLVWLGGDREMTHYTGTLTIDAPEGYNECPAVYELGVSWVMGEPIVVAVDLISWTFDGRQQTRATAVALIGDAEVQRQESEAVEAWLDTALRDMADARADSREWIAAE